jgi:N-acetylmuramoyl-L-alanine amidase
MATKYRKPRRINTVSVGLLLLFGLGIYVIVCTWPVYSLSSRAKGVLLDAIPMFYRANLRSEDVASAMIRDLKKSVPLHLRKAGVRDANLEVVFTRSAKEVSIEAHFVATALFPVINKTFEFHLSPRAVTDAARIEW